MKLNTYHYLATKLQNPPLLLNIKQSYSIRISQQQHSSSSIENFITVWSLNFLSHLIFQIFYHQLEMWTYNILSTSIHVFQVLIFGNNIIWFVGMHPDNSLPLIHQHANSNTFHTLLNTNYLLMLIIQVRIRGLQHVSAVSSHPQETWTQYKNNDSNFYYKLIITILVVKIMPLV